MAHLYDLMDEFDAATADEDRDRLRDEIQDLGFLGVAATIGTGAEGAEQQRLVREAVARGTWRR